MAKWPIMTSVLIYFLSKEAFSTANYVIIALDVTLSAISNSSLNRQQIIHSFRIMEPSMKQPLAIQYADLLVHNNERTPRAPHYLANWALPIAFRWSVCTVNPLITNSINLFFVVMEVVVVDCGAANCL